MSISLMFKVFTKDGRQNLARELIKPYISIDKISNELANGVCALANKSTEKVEDSRCESVSVGCKLIGGSFNTIGDAISPNGEEGKKISESERIEISARMKSGLEMVLSEELLNNIVECVISRIP